MLNIIPELKMSSPMARKHNDILKLISLYKNNPCLWDPSETGANMHDRRMVYDEIAAEMGCSSEDVKCKLRNLRAQFRREVARQKRLNTKRPKWIYYNPLSFLRPTIDYVNELNDSRAASCKAPTIESDVDQEWKPQVSSIDEDTTMTNFNEDSQVGTPEDSLHNEQESDLGAEAISANNSANDKRKSNGKRVYVISRHRTEERDQFTIFGEHVANELRLLDKHKDLQKALKCSILQSILDVNRANAENATEEINSEENFLEEYVT